MSKRINTVTIAGGHFTAAQLAELFNDHEATDEELSEEAHALARRLKVGASTTWNTSSYSDLAESLSKPIHRHE